MFVNGRSPTAILLINIWEATNTMVLHQDTARWFPELLPELELPRLIAVTRPQSPTEHSVMYGVLHWWGLSPKAKTALPHYNLYENYMFHFFPEDLYLNGSMKILLPDEPLEV